MKKCATILGCIFKPYLSTRQHLAKILSYVFFGLAAFLQIETSFSFHFPFFSSSTPFVLTTHPSRIPRKRPKSFRSTGAGRFLHLFWEATVFPEKVRSSFVFCYYISTLNGYVQRRRRNFVALSLGFSLCSTPKTKQTHSSFPPIRSFVRSPPPSRILFRSLDTGFPNVCKEIGIKYSTANLCLLS